MTPIRLSPDTLGSAGFKGPGLTLSSVHLQSIFANLALSNKDFHRPGGFWKAFKDYDGAQLSLREHQDAYEFFTRLQVTPRTSSGTHDSPVQGRAVAGSACCSILDEYLEICFCTAWGTSGLIISCSASSFAVPNSCNCGLWTCKMESFASPCLVVG